MHRIWDKANHREIVHLHMVIDHLFQVENYAVGFGSSPITIRVLSSSNEQPRIT